VRPARSAARTSSSAAARFGPFIACSAYPECRYTRNLNGEGKVEDETTNETCATCGRPMVNQARTLRQIHRLFGYPECKTTKPVTLGIPCPESGCQGELVQRRSKRGRTFYGCSAYPTCKFVLWQRPVAEAVPEVRGALHRRTRGPQPDDTVLRARGL